MIKYAETTAFILAWSFLLSLAWAFGCFWLTAKREKGRKSKESHGTALLPSLVLGPLLLIGAFRLFGLNLIFPVHLFASLSDLICSAFFPALIVTVASGLLGNLLANVRAEYSHWRAQRFVLVGEALGKSVVSSVRRLVLAKSLTNSWSETLPWLFGELIVVEAIFNAPGLGLDAWQAAKMRDFSLLGESVAWLAGIYLACVFLASYASGWIGRRLESYG
jgi:ABC-type dipeptide/oligopeptide/nickel transport system permease component